MNRAAGQTRRDSNDKIAGLRKNHLVRHYALETGCRRKKPRIRNTRPVNARGITAADGINAVLIPLARSEGFGDVVEFATASNDHIIINALTKRQHNANPSKMLPVITIQRVGRVRGAAVGVLASYGF